MINNAKDLGIGKFTREEANYRKIFPDDKSPWDKKKKNKS